MDRDIIAKQVPLLQSSVHMPKPKAKKGIKFLRNIYAASGLSIRPKTRINKVKALKEIIRAWGLNPEKILTREALTEPHRTVIDFKYRENNQLEILSKTLRELIRQETAVQMCSMDGGSAGN
jgi:hypothetical protein